MMRNRFDEQLNELNSEMIHMGALCEEVIALAVAGLKRVVGGESLLDILLVFCRIDKGAATLHIDFYHSLLLSVRILQI